MIEKIVISETLKSFFAIFFCATLYIPAWTQDSVKISIKILPNELWWAGIVSKGSKMPFGSGSSFYYDMRYNDCSQVQPLLLSTMGRVIWNNDPFKIYLKNDSINLSGTSEFIVSAEGNTLADAQKFSRTNYFPSSGIIPDSNMFVNPQYNTWIELNYNQSQKDILAYAHAVVDNGFPPGVLMIDASWQQDYGLWDFRPGNFSDPKAMVDELHRLGFKVMLWIVPFISPDCTAFYQLHNEKKILIVDRGDVNRPEFIKWWEGYSAEIDFTNPAGASWFMDQLHFLQSKYGIDGFKFDAGDFDRFPSFGGTLKKISGNEHSMLYSSIGLEFPFNEYRVSWKMGGMHLAQRLCDKEHTWTDLKKLVPEMLVMSLSGYNYACPDMIGGGEIESLLKSANNIDQELVVRSAQCQALMPMMQFSAAPWRILDSIHLNAVKQSLRIRSKFINYILNLTKEAAKNGSPIVRPVEYVYPDQGFADDKTKFMLGDKVLVVPILEKGAKHIQMNLPKLKKGNWVSDEGVKYKSGAKIEIKVSLNRLPYFEVVE